MKQSSWKRKELTYGKAVFVAYLKFAVSPGGISCRFVPSVDPPFPGCRHEELQRKWGQGCCRKGLQRLDIVLDHRVSAGRGGKSGQSRCWTGRGR